ncbi:MAG: hypothetical protein IPI34_11435 [bacterium]|nr:hypothetical protein [bacterium]
MTPTSTVTLGGVLHNGDVHVIGHTLAVAAITSQADLLINGGVVNFNGNDAVVLKLDGAVVDCIGQVGIDPGAAWGTEPCTTVTTRTMRGIDVCGRPVTSDAFEPAPTWVRSAVWTRSACWGRTRATARPVRKTTPRTWGGVTGIYR